jgi:hypothetical protein
MRTAYPPPAMLLALLLVTMQGFSSAQSVADGEGPVEPEEKEVTTWPFILISIILVLSISFETMKETIEHHTPHVFEPITDAFFGELATLGFIGAIAFTLTYNFDSSCEGACSVMQRLSEQVLGNEEELQEVFEELHFMLFAISVVFIFVVLTLLKMTLNNAEKYEKLDSKIVEAMHEAAKENQMRRARSHSHGSGSKSPKKGQRGGSKSPKKATSPVKASTNHWTSEEQTLRDSIDEAMHERENYRVAESNLMAADRANKKSSQYAASPNADPFASLLMWGSNGRPSGKAALQASWFSETFGSFYKPQEASVVAEYFRLRHRFIDDEQESVNVSIPHDFDFSSYLKKVNFDSSSRF